MDFPIPLTELNVGILVSVDIIHGDPGFEFLTSPIDGDSLYSPVTGEQLTGVDQ